MGSRTKVSKLTRVVQGKTSVIFELTDKGLVIEHNDTGREKGFTRFTLKIPGVDALRELLGLQQPLLNKHAENKPVVPLDEVAKRFTREGDDTPPSGNEPREAPVEGTGLVRSADRTESGMD